MSMGYSFRKNVFVATSVVHVGRGSAKYGMTILPF